MENAWDARASAAPAATGRPEFSSASSDEEPVTPPSKIRTTANESNIRQMIAVTLRRCLHLLVLNMGSWNPGALHGFSSPVLTRGKFSSEASDCQALRISFAITLGILHADLHYYIGYEDSLAGKIKGSPRATLPNSVANFVR